MKTLFFGWGALLSLEKGNEHEIVPGHATTICQVDLKEANQENLLPLDRVGQILNLHLTTRGPANMDRSS